MSASTSCWRIDLKPGRLGIIDRYQGCGQRPHSSLRRGTSLSRLRNDPSGGLRPTEKRRGKMRIGVLQSPLIGISWQIRTAVAYERSEGEVCARTRLAILPSLDRVL